MHKYKIRLDTQSEVAAFVNSVQGSMDPVYVTDNKTLRVNAKSLLGMLYALEFDELWCECGSEIYYYIAKYVI